MNVEIKTYLPVKFSLIRGKSTAGTESCFCEAAPFFMLNLISYLTFMYYVSC